MDHRRVRQQMASLSGRRPNMVNRLESMLGAALLALLLGWHMPKVLAQATATIVGTVQDSNGAVIPNASVTLTSETRGTTFAGLTHATGDFNFSSIPGDTYRITVTMTGF